MGLFNWCMLIAMIIPNVLNLVYSYSSDYQTQGRYSLPMLIPLAYFVTSGLSVLLRPLKKKKIIEEIVFAILALLVFVAVLYVYKVYIRYTYLPNPLIKL